MRPKGKGKLNMAEITIKKITEKEDIASCHSCFARNYQGRDSKALGLPESVSYLYQIRIGSTNGIGATTVTLCPECLKTLGKEITTALASEPDKKEQP